MAFFVDFTVAICIYNYWFLKYILTVKSVRIMSFCMRYVIFAFVILISSVSAVSISNIGGSYTDSFDDTSGDFSNRLNWTASGYSSVDDLDRGVTDFGVTTGGLYSFNTSNGGYAWGIQPTGTDFSPGEMLFFVTNNTGQTVNTIEVSFDLLVYNDQDRSSSIDFAFSTDGATTYTDLVAFSSAEAADTSASIASHSYSFTTAAGNAISTSLSDGNSAYFRFSIDDLGGSGSRDEFAVDNVMVTFIPEPSSSALVFIGLSTLIKRRRRSASH